MAEATVEIDATASRLEVSTCHMHRSHTWVIYVGHIHRSHFIYVRLIFRFGFHICVESGRVNGGSQDGDRRRCCQ